MVSRAYGRALTTEEIEDVYSAAWAATLSALRVRGKAMTDGELRAYVMTAVASHASKELRRRTRKPAGALEATHEQVLSDVHVPLPDEAAIGAESAEVARDVLASLPPRRRAVMLLRYGWGLAPKEVCGLVAGLSPRAYRKEVTRGVEELIERLKQVETGEWCESREPLIRDYAAGLAGEEERRQVEQHLSHCRACAAFALRLTGHLHDMGASIAVAGLTGVIGGWKVALGWRIGDAIDAARTAVAAAGDRASTLANLAPSGSAAAPGAGFATKLLATGGGKAALACLGTGAAATACIAAGAIPNVDLGVPERARPPMPPKSEANRAGAPSPELQQRPASASVVRVSSSVAGSRTIEEVSAESRGRSGEPDDEAATSTAAPTDPVVSEFDPVAAAAQAPAPVEAPPPEASPAPSSAPSVGESDGSSVAGEEFGP